MKTLDQKKERKEEEKKPSVMLEKFNGEWTFQRAAHLLRRTTYGPKKSTILEAVDLGLDASIERLLSAPTPTDPPIYIDFEDDPQAGIGETWVDKPLDDSIQGIFFSRGKTMWPWLYRNMRSENFNIVNKLYMFWHNHFSIDNDINPNFQWTYLNLLRDNCLGNFRELTKAMTINKSMLVFLNGDQNLADEPNENYARELLELFTIGRGPLAGEGDYTNYTEQDIASFARALTGWSPWNTEFETGHFRTWAYDNGEKQLSHRFNNLVIQPEGDQEYKRVVDIIFSKDEVARHISRRLFIWFVNYNINDDVEANVIEPMAQLILENDYEMKPAISALLSSEYFFKEGISGSMIKNPLDYVMSIVNTFNLESPQDTILDYEAWLSWHWDLDKLGFVPFKMPSVAGWPAYHQAPIFYRDWINSASLAIRKKMIDKPHYIYPNLDPNLPGYNFIEFIATLDNPLDINDLIKESCDILYPRKLSQENLDFFKEVVLEGLPDFEWGVEYNDYLQNPSEEKRIAVERKLCNLYKTMFSIPEFQLS